MENNITFLLLLLLLLLVLWFSNIGHQDLNAEAKAIKKPMVPALYVFGDSGTDAGNNNYLNTPAKANQFPYGLDLNNHTGRFTSGKTLVEFIANYLGLPMAPAYLSLNNSERRRTTTGINYASGGCGILDTTGPGGCLTLRKQINFFASTVKNDLPKALRSAKKMRVDLAKSICMLIIGSNDKVYKLSPKWNETRDKQVFSEYLLRNLATHIRTLYDLGARKFVVQNVYRRKFQLYKRLKQLQSHLSNSTFSQFHTEPTATRVRKNAAKYGFRYLKEPCFIRGVKPVCNNRSEYLHFDDRSHVTEPAHKIVADDCFSGTMTCKPYNILALAKASSNIWKRKQRFSQLRSITILHR